MSGRARWAITRSAKRTESRSSRCSPSIPTSAAAASPTRLRRFLQRYLLGELGFHRLELACYGFNEAAIRHAERVGFVREGVKRRAYLRHGDWQDAVLFALLQEDLDASRP